MSVTGLSDEGGGGDRTTLFSGCLTRPCIPVSTISSSSSELSFTETLTLPVPPPGSTTLTSLITLSPTSITTSTTTTTSSNFISTTTATTLSVTPLPNPAATAAIAAESSLVRQNTALSRSNLISTLVLGSISFVLLIALLILLLIYLRRRSSKSDAESPPFTSLAPRPAPNFGPPTSPPPQIPLPESMRETSLSMGPRGGSTSQYRPSTSTAGQAGQTQPFRFGFPFPSDSGSISGSQALASHPLSPPTRTRLLRSSSAPTSAPEPAPSIPPFTDIGVRPPRISLFPATPFERSRDSVVVDRPGTEGGYSSVSGRQGTASDGTFGAPLRRQRSAPMYHRALREQAEREREESRSREAARLGVPVIGVVGRESGGDLESEISSEMSFGSEGSGEKGEEEGEGRTEGPGTQPLQRGQRFAGGNGGQGSGERGRPLHSTRASSGVFPEGRESRDEEEEVEEEKDTHS